VGLGEPGGASAKTSIRLFAKLARTIAAKPPATVAAGKRAFYQQMDLGLEQAYALASGVISASFAHEEGRAGMDAFIEKRPPPKH
jgi:enoyl-CoA hydratase/carnithine racemase